MFGTDEAPARAVGLFDSLYVETTRAGSGAVDVSMGVANPTALLVIFALCLTALALTQVIYQALTQYRLDLIEARAST